MELLPFEQARGLIEGENAPNSEIMAYRMKLTCDVSIMAQETKDGKPFYSILLYFPPENHQSEESTCEAYAELVYREDGEKITSLDEAIRLLGIASDAPMWESEQ